MNVVLIVVKQLLSKYTLAMKVDKYKVLIATYWFLFVVLICVSYIFIAEVWQDYINERTDIAHEEQPITKHPALTVSFLERKKIKGLYYDIECKYFMILGC